MITSRTRAPVSAPATQRSSPSMSSASQRVQSAMRSVQDIGAQVKARIDAAMSDAFERVKKPPMDLSGGISRAPSFAPSSMRAPSIAPSSPMRAPAAAPAAPAPAPAGGAAPTAPDTGLTTGEIDAARAQNVSTEGLDAASLTALDAANAHGLHLTGGVGTWNDFHAHGTSIDVSNYNGEGFTETPEMRAYADEMVELGRSGAVGPDGEPLVAYVVYAGKRAGINTNWEWQPVSQPNDITQGHWDHVHVSTDNAH